MLTQSDIMEVAHKTRNVMTTPPFLLAPAFSAEVWWSTPRSNGAECRCGSPLWHRARVRASPCRPQRNGRACLRCCASNFASRLRNTAAVLDVPEGLVRRIGCHDADTAGLAALPNLALNTLYSSCGQHRSQTCVIDSHRCVNQLGVSRDSGPEFPGHRGLRHAMSHHARIAGPAICLGQHLPRMNGRRRLLNPRAADVGTT